MTKVNQSGDSIAHATSTLMYTKVILVISLKLFSALLYIESVILIHCQFYFQCIGHILL